MPLCEISGIDNRSLNSLCSNPSVYIIWTNNQTDDMKPRGLYVCLDCLNTVYGITEPHMIRKHSLLLTPLS
jgi:hypothetical protein